MQRNILNLQIIYFFYFFFIKSKQFNKSKIIVQSIDFYNTIIKNSLIKLTKIKLYLLILKKYFRGNKFYKLKKLLLFSFFYLLQILYAFIFLFIVFFLPNLYVLHFIFIY